MSWHLFVHIFQVTVFFSSTLLPSGNTLPCPAGVLGEFAHFRKLENCKQDTFQQLPVMTKCSVSKRGKSVRCSVAILLLHKIFSRQQTGQLIATNREKKRSFSKVAGLRRRRDWDLPRDDNLCLRTCGDFGKFSKSWVGGNGLSFLITLLHKFVRNVSRGISLLTEQVGTVSLMSLWMWLLIALCYFEGGCQVSFNCGSFICCNYWEITLSRLPVIEEASLLFSNYLGFHLLSNRIATSNRFKCKLSLS